MDVKTMQNIKVYNHYESVVVLPTREKDRQHRMQPAKDDIPSMISMSWNELELINNNTSAIRNGIIELEEDIRNELYESLRIHDWENILFYSTIKNILLTPSVEKLQRIVDITSATVIARVKGILSILKSEGHDISVKVDRLVNTRFNEISNRKLKSQINLVPRHEVDTETIAEDVGSLMEENQEMKDELAELKEKLNNLLNVQATPKVTESVTSEPVSTPVEAKPEPKKRGRPPKNK